MSGSAQTQSWRQLAVIQVGGSICLPVVMIGQVIALDSAWSSVVLAIILGNLLLFSLAWVIGSAGARQKKSTAQLAVDCFGEKGKKLFSLLMVVSMLGWFSIQLQVMGLCLEQGLQKGGVIPSDSNFFIGPLLLGCVIAAVSLLGLRGITRVAQVITPLLICTLGYALFQTQTSYPLEWQLRDINLTGISFVVAGSIAAVIDLPTFFRVAESPKDAIKASFILFCLALPLLEMSGAYLAASTHEENIVSVLEMASSNWMWGYWIPFFLIMAGWTTNNANIYSACVSLEQLLPTSSPSFKVGLVCTLGSLLACLPIINHLEIFLGLIGTLLCSMGGVMSGSLIFGHQNYRYNIGAFAIGTVIGLLAITDIIAFTGLPVVDAFISALACQVIINKGVTYETNLS